MEQTKSVRLQRLANTMEIRSNRSSSFFENTGEMVKLPALRAINKSVKYNNLSFATTRNLQKLQKEPDVPDNIEEMSAHHNLVLLRKKYDNLNKDREALQREVDTRQREHDKLKAEKERFENEKQNGSATVASLNGDLQNMKLKLQQSQTEKKVLLGMVGRLKGDKIVYDLRKFNWEKELKHLQKQLELIARQSHRQKGEDDRTEKFKNKFLSHLSAEKEEREQHVGVVRSKVEEKIDLLVKNQKRMEEMQEIGELAVQEKDIKQKNWYKVYLCHRFVERMLRDKMTREMKEFHLVETAFKNIKTQTGVNNTEELVEKFLHKEARYGELLGKIADNERVIAQLNVESENLKKEKQKLQLEKKQLNANKKEVKDLTKEEKEFRLMEEKSTNCKSYQEQLNFWLNRSLVKFGAAGQAKSIEEHGSAELNANIITQLKSFMTIISQTMDKTKDVELNDKDVGAVNVSSNLRVSLEKQQEAPPKNSLNLNDQEDFINQQRQEVLRSNQKFMKELRKKVEDQKKAKMDAQPKKREVVVQKPKPVPVQA